MKLLFLSLKNDRILTIPYGPTQYTLTRSNKLCTQSTQWGGKGTGQGESQARVSVSPYHSDPRTGGYSLFDFFGGKVQIAVADPLNLKPVPKAVVATALELNLQRVDGLLHETPAWGVRVPVELHAILEPVSQRALQGAPQEEAAEGHQEEDNVEEDTHGQVWLQPGLPLGVLGRVQGVIADFTRQRIEDTGQHPHPYQGIGHKMALGIVHHIAPLPEFNL